MIFIKEDKTQKQPGKTSLFISFDYSQKIVDTLKTVDNGVYNKKTKIWEYPATALSSLIQRLQSLDDIDLSLLEIENKKEKEVSLLCKYKTKPFPYQEEGIKYGLTHNKWMLLDPPGLGKSFQMIALAQELRERGEIEHCLIICGINTLKKNWKEEILKHSDLSAKIIGEYYNSKGKLIYGGLKERIDQLKNPIEEFFAIINIESLRNNDLVNVLNNGPNKFDMIVFDEMHKAKSSQSQQGHGLLKLRAKYQIGLTGTLIVNSPLDAYTPLKWLDKDNSTLTNFKYYYCNFSGPFHNILTGFKNTQVLKDQIEECSLRRSKDLLSLPEKTIINEEVEMDPIQEKFYQNIVEGIVEQVDKVHITTSSLLAMLIRLRQATSCPSILTTEDIPSSKIDRCCDLVEQIISNNEKVVIFSQFKETLTILEQRLEKYKPLVCTGDIKDSIIFENKEKFQTLDDYKVMLCTSQKMGTGVTLTAANYAIFIDSSYTRALNEQCEDRIHRIGSKKPVFIYYLWNTDTVDMRVKEIVEDKSMISDYMIDDKCSPQLFNKLKEIITDL